MAKRRKKAKKGKKKAKKRRRREAFLLINYALLKIYLRRAFFMLEILFA
jgi:hypothetical protein